MKGENDEREKTKRAKGSEGEREKDEKDARKPILVLYGCWYGTVPRRECLEQLFSKVSSALISDRHSLPRISLFL